MWSGFSNIHDTFLAKVINMVPLSCTSDNTWEHGNSLINYMKMADINGLTGRIKFDENGLRTDFELEIVELKKHGLDKVDIQTSPHLSLMWIPQNSWDPVRDKKIISINKILY